MKPQEISSQPVSANLISGKGKRKSTSTPLDDIKDKVEIRTNWPEMVIQEDKPSPEELQSNVLRSNLPTNVPATEGEIQKPEKQWTILGYFDGLNDLEFPIALNLLDMEKVGSNDNVNLVVELGRAGEEIGERDKEAPVLDGNWSGVRRYYVIKPPNSNENELNIVSPVIEDLSNQKVDMGDWKHLADFIEWGMKNYPAKHYALVISDHGGGFLGVCWDDIAQNHITLKELSLALDEVAKRTGKKIDVVGMDACLMSQAEVAYALSGKADYLVASEEIEGGLGWPFESLLKRIEEEITKRGYLSPKEFSREVVEAAEVRENELLKAPLEHRGKAGKSPEETHIITTLSAIDLNKLVPLKDSINEFAVTLLSTYTSEKELREVIKRTERFGDGTNIKPFVDFRDLYDFARLIYTNPKIRDKSLKKAAADVMTKISDAVVAHQDTLGAKRSHGISIYMPTNYGFDKPPKGLPPEKLEKFDPTYHYVESDFARDTLWDEFLADIAIKKETPKTATKADKKADKKPSTS